MQVLYHLWQLASFRVSYIVIPTYNFILIANYIQTILTKEAGIPTTLESENYNQ